MTEPEGPILDYASQRTILPLRMAEESVLEIFAVPEGTDVLETLVGKTKAIAAIIFSLFSTTLLATQAGYLYLLANREPGMKHFFVFTLGLIIAAGVVSLLTIRATWQRTILEIRPDRLTLKFESPFGKRRYEWTLGRILRVLVVSYVSPDLRDFIDELHLETETHPIVKLFAGHAKEELAKIVGFIDAVRLKTATIAKP